jgi:hypothetical protein
VANKSECHECGERYQYSDGKPFAACGCVNSRSLTAAEKALLDEVFRNYLLSADCLADPEHLEPR